MTVPLNRRRFRLAAGLFAWIMVLAGPVQVALAEGNYPLTISLIKMVAQDEARAHQAYIAYSRQAVADNYPGIARLFIALAASESIHAANFNRILADLGAAPPGMMGADVKVGSTRDNLKIAIQVELNEIDKIYPAILVKIQPENHEAARRFVNYAWKSEKQHRGLIKKIQAGTGVFFDQLDRQIGDSKVDFVVCQNCGSTLQELPRKRCPICGEPVSRYKKIGGQ